MTTAHNDRRTLAALDALVLANAEPTVTAMSQHSGLTARQTLNALDRLTAAGVVRFGRDGWGGHEQRTQGRADRQ